MIRFFRQRQRAGDNSSQLIVHGDLHLGVSEEQATAIARQQSEFALRELAEAGRVGDERVQALDELLIRTLSARELLGAFSDPAFVWLLRRSQVAAASSGRDADYELLVEMLSARAASDSRLLRANVNKAVEVVDSVDERALLAMTAYYTFHGYAAGGSTLQEKLDRYDRWLSGLALDDLPEGPRWLEHLETLGLATVFRLGLATLKSVPVNLSERWPWLFATGVPEEEKSLVERRIADAGLLVELVPHELRPGYWRFPATSHEECAQRLQTVRWEAGEDAATAMAAVLELAGVNGVNGDCLTAVERFIDERPSLAAFRVWLHSVPDAFSLTGPGRVLASASVRRTPAASELPAPDLATL